MMHIVWTISVVVIVVLAVAVALHPGIRGGPIGMAALGGGVAFLVASLDADDPSNAVVGVTVCAAAFSVVVAARWARCRGKP